MKLKNTLLICSIGIALLFTSFACSPKMSGSAQNQIDDTPAWVYSPPQDDDQYLYATASANSSRQNVARQRAEINAKQVLAGKLGEKVEALQKIFEDEVSDGNEDSYSASFSNATQIITSQELIGVGIDELIFLPTDRGGFTAHVLLRMPVGDARSQLENALSRDEELYIKFKESQAFDELQENLERLGLD